MTTFRSFVPITQILAEADWPAALRPAGGGALSDLLSKIHLSDYDLLPSEEGIAFAATIVVFEEIAISVPGVEGLALVLGGGVQAGTTGFRATFFATEGRWSLRLDDLEAALRLPGDVLRPAPDAAGFVEPYLKIALRGSMVIDQDLEVRLEGFDALKLTPAYIGETGIVISADDVKLDLSRTSTLPEVLAAGFDESFIGIWLGEARVKLPPGMPALAPAQLVLRNAAIGTGGVSGTLEALGAPVFDPATRAFSGPGSTTVFGIPFGLERAKITLRQNALVEAAFGGRMLLPFFDEVVAMEVGLDDRGAVSARIADGLPPLQRADLLRLEPTEIALTAGPEGALVRVSGALTPLAGGLTWPTLHLEGLSIDSRGRVQIEGSWIDLPQQATLGLGGFQAQLTQIGFGSEEDGTRWIGFSGGVRLVEGIPGGGAVEGLRIKWKGSEIDLELRGIRVQIESPGAFRVDGHVALVRTPERTEFRGGVKLELLPIALRLDAQMLVGTTGDPPFPYAYLFLEGQMPAGIPIANTGVALYGLAGLLGHNVAPDKRAEESWFDGWYARAPMGVSDAGKWASQRGHLAFGAGATLGTAPDNGYAYHGDFLLVLLLPGPVILLDGRSRFLQSRGAGDPQLVTLAVLDGQAGTLLFNVHARYRYPGGGELVDAGGSAEAFFDFGDARKWHLHLGLAEPREKRIRAEFLTLFEANSYLNLDAAGVRGGVWFGYDERWRFGPLRLTLEAWIEGHAALSWSPVQFEGNLHLHGDVGLRAWKFEIGIALDAKLAVKAPRPYRVHASFKVKINLPWPLPDPSATVEILWERAGAPPFLDPLEEVGAEHLLVTEKWPLASGSTPLVPMDARPVLSFQRRMGDPLGLGAHALPTPAERVGGYLFAYELRSLRLERLAASGMWEDLTPLVRATWQAVPSPVPDATPQDVPPMTKLMLWATTPFEWGREAGAAPADGFADANPDYPCGYDWEPRSTCHDYDSFKLGTFPAYVRVRELVYLAEGVSVVESPSPRGTRNALHLHAGSGTLATHARPASRLLIAFPPNAGMVFLHFAPMTSSNNGAQEPRPRVRVGAGPWASVDTQEPHGVELPPGGASWIMVAGPGILQAVCWVERAEWARVVLGSAAQERALDEANAALRGEAVVLDPDTDHRLVVVVRAKRSANATDWEHQDYTTTRTFRTGPPPALSTGAPATDVYPHGGPLRDLAPYVAATTPPAGAVAHYRAYDVGVRMHVDYADVLYLKARRVLGLRVLDANGLPALQSKDVPAVGLQRWATLAPGSVPPRPSEAAYAAALESGCGEPDAPRAPAATWISTPRGRLAPAALHRALLTPLDPVALLPLAADGTIALDATGNPAALAPGEDVAAQAGALPHGALIVCAGGVVELKGSWRADDAQLALARAALPAGAAAFLRVHDWSFTTSRFAGFAHHLHSGDDRLVWIAAPLDAAGAAWLAARLAETSAGSPAATAGDGRAREASAFESFARLVDLEAGVETAGLATSVLLDGTGAPYALLLRSPEPLDWARITLALSRAPTATNSSLAPDAAAKLVGRGMAAAGAGPNAESVDILVLRERELRGWKVEVHDGAGWVTHATLPGGPVADGTLLRLHSGGAAADPPGGRAAEMDHLYAHDLGGDGSLRVSGAAARVRLLDEAGGVVHEREWREEPRNALAWRGLRSRDDRSLLLFVERAGDKAARLETGTYRLQGTFARSRPGLPDLPREGSLAAETAFLEIALP